MRKWGMMTRTNGILMSHFLTQFLKHSRVIINFKALIENLLKFLA
jgi:hypothetical protein